MSQIPPTQDSQSTFKPNLTYIFLPARTRYIIPNPDGGPCNVTFIFWALEFQEKMLLRFTDFQSQSCSWLKDKVMRDNKQVTALYCIHRALQAVLVLVPQSEVLSLTNSVKYLPILLTNNYVNVPPPPTTYYQLCTTLFLCCH